MLPLRIAPALTVLTLMTSLPPPQSPPNLHPRIASQVEKHQPEYVALRRDLHRHPELSGREVRTADVIAKQLIALDLDVRTGVGGHGVVGILKGGRPGPLVAYRADMDAFPSALPSPRRFRPKCPACVTSAATT